MTQRRALLSLVGAILLLTTAVAAGLGVRTDRQVAAQERSRALEETSGSLQALTQGAVGRVEDVGNLFRTSSVSADDFAVYTEPMLSSAGATSIAWIRVVRGSERGQYERQTGNVISVMDGAGRRTPAPRRAQYAVTTFVKTVADDTASVGVDESTDPRRSAAMTRAARTRSPQATAPLTIDRAGRSGFVVYVPVYPPGTLSSSRRMPLGFAAAAFTFADGESKLATVLHPGSAARISIAGTEVASVGQLRKPVATTRLMVAGQPWSVTVSTPAAPTEVPHLNRGETALLAGSLLTVLILALMWQALVSSRRAEELSTLRQRERDAAVDERERAEQVMRELLAHLSDLAMVRFDGDLRVVSAKGGLVERAGWSATELEGTLAADVFKGEDGDRLRAAMERALEGESTEYSSRGIRDPSRLLWMQTLPLPGEPTGGLIVISDVSSLMKAESARDQAQARFEQVFSDAPVGMAILSSKGKFIQVNEAMAAITGFSAAELTGGMGPPDITHPDDHAVTTSQVAGLLSGRNRSMHVEKRYLHKDGRVVWVALHTTTLPDADGNTEYILAHVIDVTERHEFSEQLQHLADHDPLTDLRNRRSFEQALHMQVALVHRYGPEGALLLIDLDHFKEANDTAGHHAGDRILETVADTLRTSLRASDVIGRLGGDEFAVMLPKADETEARIVAAKIGDRIRERCAGKAGNQIREQLPGVGDADPPSVTASIGVVVLDQSHATADQALIAADRAMYEAKAAGRDGFAVAAPVAAPTPRAL